MSRLLLDFPGRLDQLRRHLSPSQAILLSQPSDVTYFSGFITLVPQEREALLLITHQHAYLCHAHFSPFSANGSIQSVKGSTAETVIKVMSDFRSTESVKQLFIDESTLFVDEYKKLQSLSNAAVKPLDQQWIWNIRTIKDHAEQQAITQAGEMAKRVMDQTLTNLAVGQTEQQLRDIIENELKHHGSESPAFPTIVAFGAHAALPHHQPSATKLRTNTPVLLDFGATYQGYRSDMTRTVWFGSTSPSKFWEIEKVVHQAYQAAKQVLDKIAQQTITAQDVDTAARSILSWAGCGEAFIHTTGHGVGLDIHEPPSLNSHNSMVLKPSMVVTIEPGVYFEDSFGYRYENSLLLTTQSAVELTA